MRLFEYQAKHQLHRYAVAIPYGLLVTSFDEVRRAIINYNGHVIAKPQGSTATTTTQLTENNLDIKAIDALFSQSENVKYLLLEEVVDVSRRIYVTLQTNQHLGKLSLHASSDIANKIVETEKLINPLAGLRDYQMRDIASTLQLEKSLWQRFTDTLKAIYQCYVDNDTTYLSIRPLALTRNQNFVVLSTQMEIDDNALHRQPHIQLLHTAYTSNPYALRAQQSGILYTPLTGNVSCIANGTGLALAIIDELTHSDLPTLEPANLMDVGNIVQTDRIDTALQIALQDDAVQAIVICLFGGITPCDKIAERIIAAYEGIAPNKPIVVRLSGIHAEIGKQRLLGAPIPNVFLVDHLSELGPTVYQHLFSQS